MLAQTRTVPLQLFFHTHYSDIIGSQKMGFVFLPNLFIAGFLPWESVTS